MACSDELETSQECLAVLCVDGRGRGRAMLARASRTRTRKWRASTRRDSPWSTGGDAHGAPFWLLNQARHSPQDQADLMYSAPRILLRVSTANGCTRCNDDLQAVRPVIRGRTRTKQSPTFETYRGHPCAGQDGDCRCRMHIDRWPSEGARSGSRIRPADATAGMRRRQNGCR